MEPDARPAIKTNIVSGNRQQFQHVHLWKMQLKWLETGHFHKYFAVIFVAPHLHESSFLALPRHHERNGLVPNPRYETHPLFDTLSIYNLLQWTSSSLEKNWAELTGDPRTKAERGCIGLMASQLHRWETTGWIVSKTLQPCNGRTPALGFKGRWIFQNFPNFAVQIPYPNVSNLLSSSVNFSLNFHSLWESLVSSMESPGNAWHQIQNLPEKEIDAPKSCDSRIPVVFWVLLGCFEQNKYREFVQNPRCCGCGSLPLARLRQRRNLSPAASKDKMPHQLCLKNPSDYFGFATLSILVNTCQPVWLCIWKSRMTPGPLAWVLQSPSAWEAAKRMLKGVIEDAVRCWQTTLYRRLKMHSQIPSRLCDSAEILTVLSLVNSLASHPRLLIFFASPTIRDLPPILHRLVAFCPLQSGLHFFLWSYENFKWKKWSDLRWSVSWQN